MWWWRPGAHGPAANGEGPDKAAYYCHRKRELVDIIAHPTGRIIGQREAYDLDLQPCSRRRPEQALPWRSTPTPRLDISDVNAKAAKEAGVRIAINSDAMRPGSYWS